MSTPVVLPKLSCSTVSLCLQSLCFGPISVVEHVCICIVFELRDTWHIMTFRSEWWTYRNENIIYISLFLCNIAAIFSLFVCFLFCFFFCVSQYVDGVYSWVCMETRCYFRPPSTVLHLWFERGSLLETEAKLDSQWLLRMGLQDRSSLHAYCFTSFYMSAEDLNSGLHTCTASIFLASHLLSSSHTHSWRCTVMKLTHLTLFFS